jgi:hypothetical protein
MPSLLGRVFEGSFTLARCSLEIIFFSKMKKYPLKTAMLNNLPLSRTLFNLDGSVVNFQDEETSQIWRQKHEFLFFPNVDYEFYIMV